MSAAGSVQGRTREAVRDADFAAYMHARQASLWAATFEPTYVVLGDAF